MDRLIVLKIGGTLLDEPEQLQSVLKHFCALSEKKILVHGGGAQANRIAKSLGHEPKMQDGRRITDEAMLDVVTMVYAGLNGKKIAALMQGKNCNAISLSGVDGNLLAATKRPVGAIDFGFVGDIEPEGVNTSFLSLLLEQDIVPVLNAITHDTSGTLLNTNADTIATTVAAALTSRYSVELLLLTDRPGVLANPNDSASLFSELHSSQVSELIDDGTIAGGMIPKIENALAAIRCGVSAVRIGDGEMLESDSAGTRIIGLSGGQEL